MEQPETYTIPEDRLGLLRAGVAKLNKRAAKLGMEPVVLVASEPRAVHYVERVVDEYDESGAVHAREIPRVRYVVDARFEGTAPRIAGFVFVAKLDHLEGGNLVLRAPGIETDLSGWRECGSRCQHCGLARRRAETFLLQSDGGDLIQIGRQCLQDYTGTTDIARAVKLFKCWRELLGGCGEEGEYGGGGGGWYPSTTPAAYVAAAVASIRKRGFHKSDSDRSTRSDCDFITGPCPKPDRDGGRSRVKEWLKSQPTDAQREEAATIIAWALASKDSSDYMHNIRLACAARIMPKRTEGLLASLPVSYDKAMGREQERRERPPAGPHVGAVGERITCKITVRLVRGYENDFGTGVMLLMADDQNSTLKTFSSGALQRLWVDDAKEDFAGEWYLRGTVKKHETDQKYGHPVTLLSRCTLQREPFKKAPSKRKPKPASKGLPMYDTEGLVAYGWKPPLGVPFSWDAYRAGEALQQVLPGDNTSSCRVRGMPWEMNGVAAGNRRAV